MFADNEDGVECCENIKRYGFYRCVIRANDIHYANGDEKGDASEDEK